MSAECVSRYSEAWQSHCGQAVALLGALVLLQGCGPLVAGGVVGGAVGAYAAKDIDVRQGKSVQVRFHPAVDVTTITAASDTSRTAAAELVVGRVMYMHGDSLLIRASEMRAGGQRLLFSVHNAPRVIVVRAEGTRVQPASDSFTYIAVGAAAGALLVAIGLIGICFAVCGD